MGFDPHLSYVKMIKAASYARNPDNLFIATNEDSFLPTPGDEVVIPGTVCFLSDAQLTVRLQLRSSDRIMWRQFSIYSRTSVL